VPSTEFLERETMRVRLLALLFLAGFALLCVTLWRIQVQQAPRYRTSLDHQSMRRVRLPGIRGRIFDARHEALADNRPSYCVAIYTEELRLPGRWDRTINRVDEVVEQLAGVLELPREVTRDDVEQHVRRRLPLPFLAWRDIDPGAMARWAERNPGMPGVDIYVEPVRVYPRGALATHLVGYVQRVTPDASAEPYHYYLPEMGGVEGLERAYDAALSGRAGGKLIRVDASGFKYDEQGEKEPRPGSDITLTVDIEVQGLAAMAMSNDCGAVVVMDPRNGDVLALVSSPAYEVDALRSKDRWAAILDDPRRPLINRAIAGLYPPGSTFKPLVAIAGLEYGRITPDTIYECTGAFHFGRDFHCWRKRGHGPLKLRKAIEQSCNPFFCQLGVRCEYERIYHMADSVGFGRRFGIDLPGEKAGLLPDDEWKRRVLKEGWRGGDTCNVSLGQGALLVTPLQMAVFAAALANGGFVYRPRLVRGAYPQGDLIVRMAWSAATMEVVRGGMYDVIHAETGTGKRAFLEGVTMAGKTGTAQFGEEQHQTWMILFAPFDAPRYAVAIVVEDAVSGGITVAPRMRELMRRLFERDGTLPRQADAGEALNG
jgi:penicillin-binding protein 2